MMKSLSQHPAVQKLNSSYDQMSRRDQRALQVLGLALALAVLFLLIWQPAREFHQQSSERAEAAAERLAWLEANMEQARRLSNSGQDSGPTQTISDSRSLMTTVTNSAQESGLVLQRFEPSGENKMRVWLDNTAFDSLAVWLEGLASEYGITVDQASLDRAGEPGRVNVRLTLSS